MTRTVCAGDERGRICYLVDCRTGPGGRVLRGLGREIVTVEGRVEIQRAEDETWLRAELDDPVCQSDTIRVGERSRAAVALIDDAVLRIDENTTLRLLSVAEEEPSLLRLILG